MGEGLGGLPRAALRSGGSCSQMTFLSASRAMRMRRRRARTSGPPPAVGVGAASAAEGGGIQ